MRYILSIDQGTTGTTALLVDSSTFKVIDQVNQEFPQIYPSPGWVEHNLHDIWSSIENTVQLLLNKTNIHGSCIDCIGITNQRETTCAWDKTGNPLSNAIVWQDRRTEPFCKALKDRGLQDTFKEKAGLPLDPYFSGSKIKWLLDNNENVKNHLKTSTLKFGTIDSFILFKLSGNISYKTDATNASRTLLMNLASCQWDEELLEIFQIQKNLLPEICDSFSNFGVTKGFKALPNGIPITGILGDQQSALFGQGGIHKGDGKCTYGTGAFMLVNTGKKIEYSKNGLLTTLAFKHGSATSYALEGSSYIAGAAVQWLRDNIKLIPNSNSIEDLARTIVNNDEMKNILFMPYFSGLGTPHWISNAQASILGLTRDSNHAHIARACLEGIALSIEQLIQSFVEDSGKNLTEIRVDGGACKNDLLMEFQSSFSKIKVIRPKNIESTALGAALAAAIGNEILSLGDVKSFYQLDKEFHPDKDNYYSLKKERYSSYFSKLYL